jgi:DNA-binding MarR family transcriptional regulator
MADRKQFAELATQLRATISVMRRMARTLPGDCQVASVGVLSVISRHGEMRIGRLAELLDIDMSVTSRHVAHLADRGWIERAPDPLDKRSRLLRLTTRGDAVLRTAQDHIAGVLADRLDGWPDEDVERFTELLARLRADFTTA